MTTQQNASSGKLLERTYLYDNERDYYVALSERINRARHNKGWTQLRLATEIGVDPVSVSYWEGGHRRPSLYQVRLLERALGVDLI